MRGKKAKALRAIAKDVAKATPATAYQDQIFHKLFVHPVTQKINAYDVYTRRMVACQRKLYKQLKEANK